MVAGGALEGLHRNTRAQQAHPADVAALEHILCTACRCRPLAEGTFLLLICILCKQDFAPVCCVAYLLPYRAMITTLPCRSGVPEPGALVSEQSTSQRAPAQALELLRRDAAALASMEAFQVTELCIEHMS